MDPHQRLALAVLTAAVEDAHRGDPGARSFLEGQNPRLAFWCSVCGVGVRSVRQAAADPQWPARLAQARAVYLSERSGRSETA